MGRFSGGGSYNHEVRPEPGWPGHYTISWDTDRYYSDSRLRFPRQTRRDTDRAGAIRFIKKHRLRWPFQAPEELLREAWGDTMKPPKDD